MFLPNASRAVVERQELVDYLLNEAHPDNGGKAEFFKLLGFSAADWERLAHALCLVGSHCSLATKLATKHGEKYVCDGVLESPSGKSARVRTVWIIDAGSETPRLVTAYPQEPDA